MSLLLPYYIDRIFVELFRDVGFEVLWADNREETEKITMNLGLMAPLYLITHMMKTGSTVLQKPAYDMGELYAMDNGFGIF